MKVKIRPGTALAYAVGIMITLAVILLARSCNTEVASLDFPTPPSTVVGDTTTTGIPDLSKVSLAPLPTGPPRSVAIGPGPANLVGVVIGPTGGIAGATVYAERLVGDSVGAMSIPTQPDGTWKLPNILGGRYRVRAWRAPDLALTTPQILYLKGNETQNLSLSLSAFNGVGATATVSPSPPYLGQTVNLVVQVTTQAVGNDGVVRGAPLPGATVDITGAPNVTISGTTPGVTDNAGRAGWALTCTGGGPESLVVTINSINIFQLTAPDCQNTVYVPPTTTTTTTVFGTTTTVKH